MIGVAKDQLIPYFTKGIVVYPLNGALSSHRHEYRRFYIAMRKM